MIILAIETSCDETALSVIKAEGDFREPEKFSIEILGNALFSQIKIHEQFGGVFPMMAKREHSKNLIPLLKKVLSESGFLSKSNESKEQKENGCQNHSQILENLRMVLAREPELLEQFENFVLATEKPPIDLIAVTEGPGLEPTLWVGINFAKALGFLWNSPIIPVNHMEGHIFASLLQPKKSYSLPNINLQTANYKLQTISFPAIALLISGGHTELILVSDWFNYKILGETRDDAVGEAFDKVARLLGLPYPGGPEISRLASEARAESEKNKITLPRPMIHSNNLDFSFSGLKTAVLYMIKKIPVLTPDLKKDIAREFEDSITEVLVSKTKKAILENEAKALVIGGGVSANKHVRNVFQKLTENLSIKLFVSEISHSTDNSIMIAATAAARFSAYGKRALRTDFPAEGNLKIGKNFSL